MDVQNQANGMCFTNADSACIYSSMFDATLHCCNLDTGRTELYANLSHFMTGYCGDVVLDKYRRVYVNDTGAQVLHGDEVF